MKLFRAVLLQRDECVKKHSVLALVIWLTVIVVVLFTAAKRVEHLLSDSMGNNQREVAQLLDVAFAYNQSSASQLESMFESGGASAFGFSLPQSLVDFPQLNSYGLDPSQPLSATYSASLTGSGSYRDLSDSTLKEINQALLLDLTAPFKDQTHYFIWSYYTSKRGFIVLSPKVTESEFHMTQEAYDKPFWGIATPARNPEKTTVISHVYEDAAGQGLMVSISTPVYHHDEFRGVVSLDVGLGYLKEVLRSGNLGMDDNLALVSKEGQIALASEQFSVSDFVITGLASKRQHQIMWEGSDVVMLSSPIKDKFHVVYQLSSIEFVRLVLIESLVSAVIASMLILVIWLVIRLRGALSRVTTLAQRDGLTSLLNRITLHHFSKSTAQECQASNTPMSVLMLDIDHFKTVNDQFGHHVGDEGIRHVAKILLDSTRKNDITGRYGGEEFVVVMPSVDLERASNLAERIRRMVENTPFSEGKTITVSIGVSDSGSTECYCFDTLFQKADMALYRAKQEGRNRTVVYHSDLDQFDKREQ